MARPKKYAESESIGVRFPVDLLSQLSSYANARQKTRSEVVVNAVSHYVHSKQCVLCGAINPEEGNHCAVCGADLFSFEEVEKAAIEIAKSEEMAICDEDRLIDKLDRLRAMGVEEIYSFRIVPCGSVDKEIMGVNVVGCVAMRLRIKGTGFWVSNDEKPAELAYHIHPNFLYAKLKGELDTMAKLRHEGVNFIKYDSLECGFN